MKIVPTFAVAGLIVVSLVACGAPRPVELNDSWPAEPRGYRAATSDWTRHGKLTVGFDQVAEIHATFKSPEWRAAFVAHRSKREALSPEARAGLLAAEKQAATEGYEIELLLATHEPRENDLSKGDKSIWKLSLIDDQGQVIPAEKIERDRRPEEAIRSDFPALGDFADAYIVRFPRSHDLMRAGASHFKLLVAGPRGKIELVWQNRR